MNDSHAKINQTLHLIEHYDQYTSDELNEILTDPGVKDVYFTLSQTTSSIKSISNIDIENEWQSFSKKANLNKMRPFIFKWSRAASIIAFICTSIIAIAIGITVSNNSLNTKRSLNSDKREISSPIVTTQNNAVRVANDSINQKNTPIMFENESLEYILNSIAKIYELEIIFNNKSAASLRLYYKLDPSLSAKEIIEELNTFKQINIHQSGNTLIID